MKKRVLLFVAILSMATALHAGKAYPKIENIGEVKFLTSSEITNLIKSNTTIVGKNLKFHKEVIKTFNEDGSYQGTIADGKKKIKGSWSIKGDTLCSKNRRETVCRKIYKENDLYVSVQGQKKIMKFKVQ